MARVGEKWVGSGREMAFMGGVVGVHSILQQKERQK